MVDLDKATNKELMDECKKRGINILSESLIRLWSNPEDEVWDTYKDTNVKEIGTGYELK